MSRAPFTFYEFFAGGGMARLGLGDDWRCAFANDFDPVKAAAYRANFPDAAAHFHEGDVWALSPADLPGHADLAWASSPCQDFSLAGARKGLEGGRSSAFFGFWKLVEGLASEGRAPRTIVIENVVGLLTSHGGADFEALCRALADQGYAFGALEIDAARFVPQSRPRVFIVATREPPPPALTGDGVFQTAGVRAAHDRLPPDLAAAWVWWRLAEPPPRNTDLASLLEPDEACAWRTAVQTRALVDQMDGPSLARLEAMRASGERQVAALYRRTRGGVPRAELRTDGAAGCLRTPRGGSSRQFVLIVEGDEVRSRWLTGREALRLMGLPDSYRAPGRDLAALAVAGDGVAAPVVRWLSEHLLAPLAAPAALTVAAE